MYTFCIVSSQAKSSFFEANDHYCWLSLYVCTKPCVCVWLCVSMGKHMKRLHVVNVSGICIRLDCISITHNTWAARILPRVCLLAAMHSCIDLVFSLLLFFQTTTRSGSRIECVRTRITKYKKRHRHQLMHALAYTDISGTSNWTTATTTIVSQATTAATAAPLARRKGYKKPVVFIIKSGSDLSLHFDFTAAVVVFHNEEKNEK